MESARGCCSGCTTSMSSSARPCHSRRIIMAAATTRRSVDAYSDVHNLTGFPAVVVRGGELTEGLPMASSSWRGRGEDVSFRLPGPSKWFRRVATAAHDEAGKCWPSCSNRSTTCTCPVGTSQRTWPTSPTSSEGASSSQSTAWSAGRDARAHRGSAQTATRGPPGRRSTGPSSTGSRTSRRRRTSCDSAAGTRGTASRYRRAGALVRRSGGHRPRSMSGRDFGGRTALDGRAPLLVGRFIRHPSDRQRARLAEDDPGRWRGAVASRSPGHRSSTASSAASVSSRARWTPMQACGPWANARCDRASAARDRRRPAPGTSPGRGLPRSARRSRFAAPMVAPPARRPRSRSGPPGRPPARGEATPRRRSRPASRAIRRSAASWSGREEVPEEARRHAFAGLDATEHHHGRVRHDLRGGQRPGRIGDDAAAALDRGVDMPVERRDGRPRRRRRSRRRPTRRPPRRRSRRTSRASRGLDVDELERRRDDVDRERSGQVAADLGAAGGASASTRRRGVLDPRREPGRASRPEERRRERVRWRGAPRHRATACSDRPPAPSRSADRRR